MIDLNPLDIVGQRELKTVPPHFSKMKLSEYDVFDKNLKTWVKTKLKGRFCLLKYPEINSAGSLKSVNIIAFEDQKEMTYFALACPYLRRK